MNIINVNRSILILTIVLIIYPGLIYGKTKIEFSGDVIQILLPAAYFTYSFLSEGRDVENFYYAFGSTMAITHILKITVPDKRPDGSNDNSYISGHTSAAFSGATLLYQKFGWKIGIPALAAASYVGWSRIESKKHYFDDVARGAIVGTLTTILFASHLNPFNLSPTIDRDHYGLQVSYKF